MDYHKQHGLEVYAKFHANQCSGYKDTVHPKLGILYMYYNVVQISHNLRACGVRNFRWLLGLEVAPVSKSNDCSQ
jgi:hypothetical protein